MASTLRSLAVLALLITSATLGDASKSFASGSAKTTRYWDCCKGSCAWPGKAAVSAPVKTCGKDNSPLSDPNAKSGCDAGGSAYMCADQTPWAVSDTLAYGFAAANVATQTEQDWCCSCYRLSFTSGSVKGKQMIVQVTNTGSDLGENHFDIAIPGGGVGIFNACSAQYGAPTSGWGKQYGGLDTNSCSALPKALQAGCNWRFDWFSDNPDVDYEQVSCPAEIVAKTGCSRNDKLPLPAGFSNPPTSSTSAAVSGSVTSTSQAASGNVGSASAQTTSSGTASSSTVAVAANANSSSTSTTNTTTSPKTHANCKKSGKSRRNKHKLAKAKLV